MDHIEITCIKNVDCVLFPVAPYRETMDREIRSWMNCSQFRINSENYQLVLSYSQLIIGEGVNIAMAKTDLICLLSNRYTNKQLTMHIANLFMVNCSKAFTFNCHHLIVWYKKGLSDYIHYTFLSHEESPGMINILFRMLAPKLIYHDHDMLTFFYAKLLYEPYCIPSIAAQLIKSMEDALTFTEFETVDKLHIMEHYTQSDAICHDTMRMRPIYLRTLLKLLISRNSCFCGKYRLRSIMRFATCLTVLNVPHVKEIYRFCQCAACVYRISCAAAIFFFTPLKNKNMQSISKVNREFAKMLFKKLKKPVTLPPEEQPMEKFFREWWTKFMANKPDVGGKFLPPPFVKTGCQYTDIGLRCPLAFIANMKPEPSTAGWWKMLL